MPYLPAVKLSDNLFGTRACGYFSAANVYISNRSSGVAANRTQRVNICHHHHTNRSVFDGVMC